MNQVQLTFLDKVEHMNPKVNNMSDFKETFNRFLEEQPELATKQKTIQTLMGKIDHLYSNSWDFIKQKKDHLVQERE